MVLSLIVTRFHEAANVSAPGTVGRAGLSWLMPAASSAVSGTGRGRLDGENGPAVLLVGHSTPSCCGLRATSSR